MSNHKGFHIRGLYACLNLISGSGASKLPAEISCKYCNESAQVQCHSVDCITQLPKLIATYRGPGLELLQVRIMWFMGWNYEDLPIRTTAIEGVAYSMGRDCRNLKDSRHEQFVDVPTSAALLPAGV